jgi:hypothetical protein
LTAERSQCFFNKKLFEIDNSGNIYGDPDLLNIKKIPVTRKEFRLHRNEYTTLAGIPVCRPFLFVLNNALYATSFLATVKLTGESPINDKIRLFVTYLLRDCFYRERVEQELYWIPPLCRSPYVDYIPVYQVFTQDETLQLKLLEVYLNTEEVEKQYCRLARGLEWGMRLSEL